MLDCLLFLLIFSMNFHGVRVRSLWEKVDETMYRTTSKCFNFIQTKYDFKNHFYVLMTNLGKCLTFIIKMVK